MKKLFVFILSLLYLCSSAGAAVHVHYCMGELDGWAFGIQKDGTCSTCGMEKGKSNNNNCCRDEQAFVKSTTDQRSIEQSNVLPKITETKLPVTLTGIITLFSRPQPVLAHYIPDSPPGTTIPVFLKNRILLI